MTDLTDILGADDLMGVLGREVQVRLLNISGSGCLVESRARLDQGTAGVLRLLVDGEAFCDDVRIARVHEVAGAGTLYQIGAEFLWTSRPGTRSLRRVVNRLRQLVARQAVTVEFTPRGSMM